MPEGPGHKSPRPLVDLLSGYVDPAHLGTRTDMRPAAAAPPESNRRSAAGDLGNTVVRDFESRQAVPFVLTPEK